MRMRRVNHIKRMMCLLLLCVWSFVTMLYLWKQIKEKDEFTLLGKPKASDRDAFHSVRRKNITKRSFYRRENLTSQNNIPFLTSVLYEIKKSLLTKRVLKLRHRQTQTIDYGTDRDIDVEGVQDYMLWFENFQSLNAHLPTLPRHQTCKSPVYNVALLKTHFTGSDVVTNILNRFGDLNNLNVALPADGSSTFYWPMRFQWKYIDITLLNGSLPNIISNHARYNNDVMDNILNPGSVYITILRDPVSQLETTFNNLGFGGLLQVTNTTDQLKKFLQFPKYYIQGVVRRKKFKDTLNLIKNGQFFDLGLATTDYHRKNIIKNTVKDLYEKFAIVLIYEYLDESLVLMKRKFCWQLDDILFLNFHQTGPNVWNREVIPEEVAEMITKWNAADAELYKFFNNTLWEEIKYEGDEFWEEVKEFRKKRAQIENECMTTKIDPDKQDKYTLLHVPSEKPPTTITASPKNEPNEQTSRVPANLIHLDKSIQNVNGRLNNKRTYHNTKKYVYQSNSSVSNMNQNISDSGSTIRGVVLYDDLLQGGKELNETNEENGTLNAVETNETKKGIQEADVYHKPLDESGEQDSNNENDKRGRSEGSGGDDILGRQFVTINGPKFYSNNEKMLSKSASSWNLYFCKKLLMNEEEYLNYFRIKHAYAKAEMKKK